MSGAPKRPHDEGTRHVTSKHSLEDSNAHPSNSSGKLVNAAPYDYHPPPIESGPDGRFAKVPRIESRDVDKRSPSPSMHRTVIPSDSFLGYPSGNRLELRDTKENKDLKVDNKITKVETKELHTESRIEPECSRDGKDIRVDSRKIDNVEIKHESEPHMDYKSKAKTEKNLQTSWNTNLNVKDSKEHDGSKYTDTSGKSLTAGVNNVMVKEHSKTEARNDPQCAGVEKDIRVESRGEDNKEIKQKLHPIDSKNDPKIVRDSPLIQGESREQRIGDRYSDITGRSSAALPSPQNNMQGISEAGKEPSAGEGLGYIGAHDAIGENKVGEQINERKRNDEKHKDAGEPDKDGSDSQKKLQQEYNQNDCKESLTGERDLERWQGERKDLHKEEQMMEKDTDRIKRESVAGVKKIENELVDGSIKMSEQENLALEQKRPKENSWKSVDKDAIENGRERDMVAEGDRPGKRRCYDKESDEGCAEGDGGLEREKEIFGNVVHQGKRMPRPRGSPQVTNGEPRFRCHPQDNDGSQGKPEVSTVVYKVGDCMRELIKLWKEFEASQENKTSGPSLEIRIPAEYVTATNRQVRGGQLWGTDIYTDDSDLVAVLMHTGYCRPTASPPPPAIQELCTTIRVLPPQYCYVSTLRNNVRSRAWGAATGCSYRVEKCCIVKKGGGTIDLEPCLTHTSTVEPTLAPVSVEHTITTRSAASNALRQQRFVREVTIQYNHCNEPWIKYSINIVADKGLKRPLYTSARLKKGEVLYLETHMDRYELCFNGEKSISTTASRISETQREKLQTQNSHSSNNERSLNSLVDRDSVTIDGFRWARCKKPLPQKVMRSIGIPLPLEHVEVLEESLEWEDVQWSQTGVWVAGKEYALARVHFLSL